LKKSGHAHLVEEEEGRLLLSEAKEFELGARSVGFEKILAAPASSPSVAAAWALCELVHLIEERVFTQFGEEDEVVNTASWVMDTGTTNLMTGAHNAFSILNTSVCDIVKFGDGSMVWIEGYKTIIFSYKSGEHHSFSGIYFIPKLKTNTFSVGQLDEVGYEILIRLSVMSIRDDEAQLMAKIPRVPNRLYVPTTTIAQLVLVCLLARGDEDSWRWHARLGHLNFQALRRWLVRNGCMGCLGLIKSINSVMVVSPTGTGARHFQSKPSIELNNLSSSSMVTYVGLSCHPHQATRRCSCYSSTIAVGIPRSLHFLRRIVHRLPSS
jgi:hypothetical protein